MRRAGSTRAAAEAGVDWILHADLATDPELEAVAAAETRLMPTMTFLQRGMEFGQEFGRSPHEVDRIKRHWDSAVRMLERTRSLGVKILCGTDSGNSLLMQYGQWHACEAEILVRYGGYSPLEAIGAMTRNNAYVVGLEGEVGVLEAGKLADIILLDSDPVADIRVLQGGQHLTTVIKDGKVVDLNGHDVEQNRLTVAQPARV
jgi:imidazolonepropionase-like amidohydrolase